MDNENAAGSYELAFHSDHTYTDSPIKVISLHALELPPSGTTTSYVSGVYAWASLSQESQEQLSGLTVRHRLRSEMNPSWPEFEADHPLCFTHPRTGKPVLFVTQCHAKEILDVEPVESARLMSGLLDGLYAPERVYVHRWQPFDFVIWDNLAVQHARSVEARISDGRRLLQRVALNDLSLEELIDRAWERQRSRELLGS
jgi:taurine dioxygenase